MPAQDLGPDESAERAALVATLVEAQDHWESTGMPQLVEQLLSFPLTIQQLKVLVLLTTERDGSTGQSLATTIGVSLATMSGIVDRLLAQGMATRTEDPDDHRVRRIRATDEGRTTIRRLLSVQKQNDLAMLDQLALDDLRALVQGVDALMRIARPCRAGGTDGAAPQG